MPKTELRRLLEDELEALAEPMRALQAEARDFWRCPDAPALAVWGNLPSLTGAPEPLPGTLTERALYDQLHATVKPALESRRYGFDSVPVLFAHDRHYRGPAFGTRFLAAVMGAEITFPDGLPPAERIGWRAGVKPLIEDISEIGRLEDVDVSQSVLLKAILQAYEELAQIVRGRMAFVRYSPTLPLDFAADIIGHERLFELIAADPDAAARLLDVCTRKWLEMMRLQERAAGGAVASYMYQPGIYVHDMILPYLSPEAIRRLVIPYNARLSAAFGGIALHINHPDPSLLDDYARLPGICACGFKQDWPPKPVLDLLAGNAVLTVSLAWHYHEGKEPWSPECLAWAEHCQRLMPVAGRVRLLATLAGWGDTPAERRECMLGDLADVRRIWDDGVKSRTEKQMSRATSHGAVRQLTDVDGRAGRMCRNERRALQ